MSAPRDELGPPRRGDETRTADVSAADLAALDAELAALDADLEDEESEEGEPLGLDLDLEVLPDGPSPEELTRRAQAVTVRFDGEEPPSEPVEVIVPEKYAVETELGRGGFGVVYLARDTVLERRVALKFLTDATPADVARLRREARFAARLDAPGFVQVYEMGETEGQAYIAMQFVEGGNLADAELPREALVRLIRDVAQALEHAHRAGVVHRDIKPENILVGPEGRPYLTDFGVARELEPSGTGTTGVIVGTPGLMSPEQALGQAARIDARTDVYSLGATLYVMLTGRRPFDRPTLLETLHAVVHEPPELPRALDPTITPGLQAIVLRCLCKDPRERYPGMRELAADLERYLAGETQLPQESTAGTRYLSYRAPSSGVPNLALALGVAHEIASWDVQRYRISRDVTQTYPQLERLIERLDGYLADHPHWAWARFYKGMALFRLGRVAAALDAMESSIDRLGDLGIAHFELGRLYLYLGMLEQQDPQRRLSFVADDDHLAVTENYLDQATVAFQEAQRLAEDTLAPWQLAFAEAVRRLAAKDREGAIETCRRILSEDADLDVVWKLLGDLLRLHGGDPVDAYERSIRIRRSHFEALHALGEHLVQKGLLRKAGSALEAALRVHPSYVPSLLLLAAIQLQEASEEFEGVRAVTTLVQKARAAAPLDPELRAEYTSERGDDRTRAFVEGVWVDEALTALQDTGGRFGRRAERLLGARALLIRARQALATGEDPRPDLDAALRVSDAGRSDPAQNEAWVRSMEPALKRKGLR